MSSKPPDSAPSLHYVIVVGGTRREWEVLADDQWADRIAELGKVADHVGARWLVLRPFSGTAASDTARSGFTVDDVPMRTQTIGSCVIEAQPDGDGRERFVRAAATLHSAGKPITETTIDALLNAPADVDPDLVVIVGASHRMPPSLVWELAYSELVYVDTGWHDFGAAHLDQAIASYFSRHRRFGGID